MDYKDLIKSIEAGQVAQVYLLTGDEPYYIDQACDYMEKNLLDEMAREFDQTVLYGRDLQGNDIAPAVAQARGFAMMGGRKVVIVKEAQTIRKWDALSKYIDNPQPQSVLVIAYKYGKPDARQAVWKKFNDKQAVKMQSDKLKDNQVASWIRNYMDERIRQSGEKITLDIKVPQMLADYLGGDLTKIVGAVDKLMMGREEGVNTIDMALVERNVGISKDYNSYELQNALINGDAEKAYRIALYYADSKDHPMIVELGILFGFFQKLLIYHYAPDKTDRVVGPEMGINPYFVKDYAKAAKRYNPMKTFKIIGYCRETDARLKGIGNPSAKEDDLWKELIYKILH